MSAPRAARAPVDPLLAAAVAELVRQHGRAAVIAAAQAVERHSPVPEATRDQKARLAALIDGLVGTMDKAAVFALVARQRNAGIPIAVTIEILERIQATRPANPWALVEHILRTDYPHHWRAR